MKQNLFLSLVILFIATAIINFFNCNLANKVFAASSCNSPCSFTAGGNCSSCYAPKTCSTGYFGGSVYGSCCCPTPTATPKPSPQPDNCTNTACNWDPLTSSQHACNPGEYCRANSSYPGTCYCSPCLDTTCGSDTTNCHNISITSTCDTSVIPCFCITPTPTPTPTPDCSNTSFASACYGLPGGGSVPGPGGSCPAGQELKTFTYATGSSTCCCPTPTPTPTPSPSPTPSPTPPLTPTSTPGCTCAGTVSIIGACYGGCSGYCTNANETCQNLPNALNYYSCQCAPILTPSSTPSATSTPTPIPTSTPLCGSYSPPYCGNGAGCPSGKTCAASGGVCGCY